MNMELCEIYSLRKHNVVNSMRDINTDQQSLDSKWESLEMQSTFLHEQEHQIEKDAGWKEKGKVQMSPS